MGNCFGLAGPSQAEKDRNLARDLVPGNDDAPTANTWRRGGKTWVETVDPETNHTYYRCAETGEHRITLPPPTDSGRSV